VFLFAMALPRPVKRLRKHLQDDTGGAMGKCHRKPVKAEALVQPESEAKICDAKVELMLADSEKEVEKKVEESKTVSKTRNYRTLGQSRFQGRLGLHVGCTVGCMFGNFSVLSLT